MTTEQSTWNFDGFGVNGEDKYKSRLATLTEEGQRLKCGPLLAAAPALLIALRSMLAAYAPLAQSTIDAHGYNALHSAVKAALEAIALAEKGML